jgi:hypothetical protein
VEEPIRKYESVLSFMVLSPLIYLGLLLAINYIFL